MSVKLTSRGLKFLATHEGCRLTAYADTAGVPTIGVGHTGLVRGQPLVVGQTRVTQQEAEELLAADAAAAERAVGKLLPRALAKLSLAQCDALVSFAFNVGAGAFAASNVKMALESNLSLVSDAVGHLFSWTKAGTDPYALFRRRACEGLLLARGVYCGPDMKELP